MPSDLTFDLDQFKAIVASLTVAIAHDPSWPRLPPGAGWGVVNEISTAIVKDGNPVSADDTRREYLRRHFRASGDRLALSTPLHVRVLSIALALATGRLERLSDEEATLANSLNLGFDIPTTRDLSEPPRGNGHVEFDVAYAFLRRPRPGQVRSLILSKTRVSVREIDPNDAPVQVLLPNASQPEIEIRKLDNTWLRPVLSPGRFHPASLAEIASALASGEAWRDRPCSCGDLKTASNHTPSDDFLPVLGLRDCAFLDDPRDDGERKRAEMRESEIARSFQSMVVIGDRLFIPCHEPRVAPFIVQPAQVQIGLDSSSMGPLTTRPVWTVGNLVSVAPQSTLAQTTRASSENLAYGWTNFPISCDRLVQNVFDRNRGVIRPPEWSAHAYDGSRPRIGSARELVGACAALVRIALDRVLTNPSITQSHPDARDKALKAASALSACVDDLHPSRVMDALDDLLLATDGLPQDIPGRDDALSAVAEAKTAIEARFDRPDLDDEDQIAASFAP